MRKLTILIMILLLISGGFSCKKEKLVGEYLFTDEMKATIPYKGYEKIIFKDDFNNHIELIAGEIEDVIYKNYIDDTETEYILCERYMIDLTNDNYRLNPILSACYSIPGGIVFHFDYTDGNYGFISRFGVLLEDSATFLLDSMLVNGTWISRIYYDTMTYVVTKPFPDELPQYPIKSYYSTSLGVVRIDFSDGTSWEMEEIIWK